MLKLQLGMVMCAVAWTLPVGSYAENLFQESKWSQMASDQRASQIGDILSVIVSERAESRNVAQNSRGRSTSLSASANTNSGVNFGDVSLASRHDNDGEVRRIESLLTSISVQIDQVLSNGDYLISGQQRLYVNGEWTTIGVRGRIRQADISSDNQILSHRIANAEINYDGQGYLPRGSKPNALGWLFSFLGL